MGNSNKLLGIVLFMISPIVSIIIAIDQIALRKRNGFILLSLIIGLFLFMYEPSLKVDLARYYLSHEVISRFENVDELMVFLNKYPDFFLYGSSYILSRVGLSFQYYLLFITIINTSLTFFVFYDIIKNVNVTKNRVLLLFSFFVVMIGLDWIIGASRQFTAFSFLLFFYYFGIWKGEKKFDLLVPLTLLVHFSSIGLVIIYYVSKFLLTKRTALKYVFYLSFIMYLIPTSFISSIVKQQMSSYSFVMEKKVYSNKLDSYALSGNSDLASSIDANITTYGRIALLLKTTIPFVLVIIITLFGGLKFDSFYYLLFILVNVTNGLISIHGRHLSFLFMIFSIFFIRDNLLKKRINLWNVIFIGFMILNSLFFFGISYSERVMNVFLDPKFLSLITIFMKDVSYSILIE